MGWPRMPTQQKEDPKARVENHGFKTVLDHMHVLRGLPAANT